MSAGREVGIDLNLCYDRETFFKISEHPICDIYPDFLSPEYFADFDGSDGSVRLWCPDRWIQSVWNTEEDKKVVPCGNKNKAPKSSSLNVADDADRKEPVDRLKSESDDTVVLSPQRRSFGAGCQAAINKSYKTGAKEGEGRRAVKPRSSRSHRSESRRGHAFNGKGGKDVGSKCRTNVWRSERRSCLSSSSKENLPEWVTEGPKDMYETVELRGFDDDVQSENVEHSLKTSASISTLNGELDKDYEVEKTDEDFHAETDAILNKFLGLARNGYKSRFREFFEQRAASLSEENSIDLHKADASKNNPTVEETSVCSLPHARSTELDVDKIVDNVRTLGLDQQSVDVARCDLSVSSSASLPGAVHLEDIETSARQHCDSTQSVQTNFILQELFDTAKSNMRNPDFSDASKAEEVQPNVVQRGSQDRTADAAMRTGNWSGDSQGGALGRESLVGFPGLYAERRQPWKTSPLPAECYTGGAEWPSFQPPPVVGRCSQRVPHRRNIPLNVINAMIELKDTPKLNTMKDYMSNIGFKEVFSRSPADTRLRSMDDSRNDSMLGHFSSSITPTSVLRQMHQEKMMHNQNEAAAKPAVRNCSGENAPGPSFLAQTSSEVNSGLTNIPPPSVIRPSAWSCQNAQFNVQEAARLGPQCLGQDSWKALGQQQTSYSVTRPRNISPQCRPIGMPVLHAHSKHPLGQRMNSHKGNLLVRNNLPAFDAGLSQYRNVLVPPQYRFPHYLPGYLPPFPGTTFGGGGRNVHNPGDMLAPASIPSNAKAVTLEELERHVKVAGPTAHVVPIDSHHCE